MKKVLFTLFALMAFLPVLADEPMQTDAPRIYSSFGDHYVTITVDGDGLLNVTLSVDGEIVEATEARWVYEYSFNYDLDDHVIIVSATAQADGWLVSDVATETFYVEAAQKPLEPIIDFVEPGSGVDVIISGQTDESYLVITITINGETAMEGYEDIGPYNFHVEPMYGQDLHIIVDAYAVDYYNGFTSDHVEGEYTLAGIPYPMLAQPIFQIEENNDYVTIYAIGDDYAYTHLIINGDEVDNPHVQYRTDEEMTLSIDALSEAPEWESSSAHIDYVVDPKPLHPVIQFEENGNGVDIFVRGRTDDVRLMVSVIVNGETFCESESDAEFTCHVETAFHEDKEIVVDAYAVNPAGIMSDHYLCGFTLLGIPYPTLPKPVIEIVESDDYVTIVATGDENGCVSLYVNNEPVENPCVYERCGEEVLLSIDAMIEAPSWESNYAHVDYVMAPKPEKKTAAPTISGHNVEEKYIVTIQPSEPSTIYYRLSFKSNENDEWEYWSDYSVYEDELTYEGWGYYRIEAYAVADGKLESECVAYEFVVTLYWFSDFYEDGIFYKITGEGKVSVCCPVSDYDRYKGHVTIPATVTHDGVTYMVTGIYRLAFAACSELTGVTIGPNVTTIGEKAFANCTSLLNVTLGDYVITVGDKAFYDCGGLGNVTLGKGVSSIGDSAFEGCFFNSVTCKAATPPRTGLNSFGKYGADMLYVHPAVLDSYQASPYWSMFRSIVGDPSVGHDNGDVNGDGALTISDVTSLISKVLRGE